MGHHVFLTTLPPTMTIPGAVPRGAPLNARLDGGELRHLTAVLRLRAGDRIELCDAARGIAVRGIIRALDGEVVTVEVEQVLTRPPTPRLTLIVGAVKPDRCEQIVEKTTEIGVRRILFFDADRSNRPVTIGNIEKRLERLARIAEGALKQSLGGLMPDIGLSPSLAEALLRVHGQPQPPDTPGVPPRTRFVFTTAADNIHQPSGQTIESSVPPFADLLRNSLLETSPADVDFHLVIGPEGGFTPSEIACVLSHGYERASLGPRVLRTETAAIVGCAAVSLRVC